MSDRIKEVIREMARLTILSGKINPIQEKTLKMYPLIIFDGVKTAKIDYDLSHKVDDQKGALHQSLVVFDLEIEKDQKEILRKCDYLELAVRDLFWADVAIEVKINGKSVYKTKPGIT